ncbi:MAG: helix-turn-helix domain-containing protein [Pseudobdellovibrionaceae bacterium]
MTKLGELLKAEREKKGLSLHEIGMGLKINPKILKAIEEGTTSDLPAKTFLRGFVKSYAQYLHLDTKHILDLFQEEYGSTRPEEPQKAQQPAASPQPVASAPKYEKSLKRPNDAALPVSNNNRIYTILFAILLLTLIAFVAKMMDKYQKESRVATTDLTSPLESTTTTSTVPVAVAEGETMATPISGPTTTESAGATTTTTLVGGTTASTTSTTTTTLKAAGSVAISSTTTTLKAAPTTTTTLKPAVPVTTSTTLKMPTTTTTLRVAAPVTITSTTTSTTTTGVSTSTTLKTASTEVIVEALNKVKVRFSLNGGQKWDTIELNPDQVHTFRTKTMIDLEISDGGAVNLIVNGRDRGVPGTIGRPIKLNYPK